MGQQTLIGSTLPTACPASPSSTSSGLRPCLGPWQRVHAWLAAASREPLTSGPDSHPFYGTPALGHALDCAADHLPGAYQRALDTLDRHMADDVIRRVDAAHHRMDAGLLPALAEFDTIRGLSGYSSYLLRRDPGSPALRAVLDYCVRLTEPVTHDGERLPGWWTDTGPSGRPDGRFRGGHANNGMAHGIGGVVALLALAARQGIVVDSHADAPAAERIRALTCLAGRLAAGDARSHELIPASSGVMPWRQLAEGDLRSGSSSYWARALVVSCRRGQVR